MSVLVLVVACIESMEGASVELPTDNTPIHLWNFPGIFLDLLFFLFKRKRMAKPVCNATKGLGNEPRQV